MYEQFCSLFEEAFDIVIGTIRPFFKEGNLDVMKIVLGAYMNGVIN